MCSSLALRAFILFYNHHHHSFLERSPSPAELKLCIHYTKVFLYSLRIVTFKNFYFYLFNLFLRDFSWLTILHLGFMRTCQSPHSYLSLSWVSFYRCSEVFRPLHCLVWPLPQLQILRTITPYSITKKLRLSKSKWRRSQRQLGVEKGSWVGADFAFAIAQLRGGVSLTRSPLELSSLWCCQPHLRPMFQRPEH